MAKLENLKDFDTEFNLALKDIITLKSTRGTKRGVWSQEQEIQFSQLLGAVDHLRAAVEHLVRLNR